MRTTTKQVHKAICVHILPELEVESYTFVTIVILIKKKDRKDRLHKMVSDNGKIWELKRDTKLSQIDSLIES